MICYAIRLKWTGELIKSSDGKVYKFETCKEANRMANVCYLSKMYEIVKVEG